MRSTRRRGRIGGLRGQLLLGLLGLLTLALSLVALATFQLHKRHLQQAVADEALRSAAWLASLDDKVQLAALQALHQNSDLLFAGLTSQMPEGAPTPNPVAFGTIEEIPVLWATDPDEQIVVAMSLQDAQRAMDQMRTALMLYLGLTLIFVTAVGYAFFSFIVVRPLRALSVATFRAAEGDLASPIQLLPRNEFGTLGRQFNVMLSRLDAQRAELGDQLEALQNAIDELRQTQNSLIRAEKLASVGQLAAGIAHEIGNPLAAVMGYTDLLRDRELDLASADDMAERSLAQLERIRKIIGQLLDYSRAESQADPTPTAIIPVIEDALHLMRAMTSARDVEFTVINDSDLPKALAVTGELSQVLINLMLNAIEAMGEARHRAPALKLTTTATEQTVQIDILDNGPGISSDIQARIFDPFFTTRAPGKGTGLGLAISQRLITRMGGDLQLIPSEEGAHFRIALRIARADHEV